MFHTFSTNAASTLSDNDAQCGHTFVLFSLQIIRTYPERMSYKPWKEAHMLYRAQCGTDEDMDPAVTHVTAISAWTNSGMRMANC